MSKIFTENKDNEEKFNIEPLVIEIEKVIRKGVNNILKDFINRYNLLETTHKQIMQLPSVVYELQQKRDCEYTFDSSDSSDSEIFNEKEKPKCISISDLTNNLIKKQMYNVENRLENIEKTLNSFNTLLNNNNAINSEKKPVEFNYNPSSIVGVCDNSIISVCENENIKLEFKEKDVLSLEKEEKEENEKEKEESDEEESEEEEELEEEEVELKEEQVELKEEQVELEEEELEEEELEEEELEEEELEEEELEEEELEEEEVELKEEEVINDVFKLNSLQEVTFDKDEIETETSEKIQEEEEEEEEELVEIEIDDKTYCTNDEENGFIYELDGEGDVGNKVGYLKEGEPFFYADEN
jgi:hypothetical protein